MAKRVARGDPGVNPLDAACKEHDIFYTQHKDSNERTSADKKLQTEAMKRAFARDATIGERATALGVAAAMKIKRKMTKSGTGLTHKKMCCKNKQMRKKNVKQLKEISFQNLIKHAKLAIKNSKPETIDSAIKVAMSSVRDMKKGKRAGTPRTIKLPKSGGVLPLIPIFAGLSALGSIAGSAAGIYGAINRVKSAEKQLKESKRHNEKMEAITIGQNKSGSGFYLQPEITGNGFFLAPYYEKNL